MMKKELLLEKARKQIEEEMRRTGFIDDSDNTDRFLDRLAKEIIEQEILKGNNDINFFYEKEAEIEEAKDELLDLIKDKIMIKYNRVGFVDERGDYRGCYFETKKGAIKWAEAYEVNIDDYIE